MFILSTSRENLEKRGKTHFLTFSGYGTKNLVFPDFFDLYIMRDILKNFIFFRFYRGGGFLGGLVGGSNDLQMA